MKQEINEYEFAQAFKDYDRDYYSYEGYQALYDYYNEFEDFDLDVIAICCDVSEYDKEELLNDYEYLVDHEEDEDKEDYLNILIEHLEMNTTIIKLDNGSYLVWEF